MRIKFSLPHGTFSLVRKMPEASLLFRNEATGQTILLSEFEMSRLLCTGNVRFTTDGWDAWGRPEVLINDEGTGWGGD